MTILQYAEMVLQKAGEPLKFKKLASRMVDLGWTTTSPNPIVPVRSVLYADMQNKGNGSKFVLVSRGVIDLRSRIAQSNFNSKISHSVNETDTKSPKPLSLSFTDSAEKVLRESGKQQPMHYKKVTKLAIQQGWLNTKGSTPESTMPALVKREIDRQSKQGKQPRFYLDGPNIGLNVWRKDKNTSQRLNPSKKNNPTMQVQFDNLGPMKRANFELGDLTIICGNNNTGKTYATYATYGFLEYLHNSADFQIESDIIDQLLARRSVRISLTSYLQELPRHIDRLSKQYSKQMQDIFASNGTFLKDAAIRFQIGNITSIQSTSVISFLNSTNAEYLRVQSATGSNQTLDVSLSIDSASDDLPPRPLIVETINEGIRRSIFGSSIPKPFIASCERTGAAIFNRELDFTKNRILEVLGDKNTKLSPSVILDKFTGEYPLPIRKNVDFIRSLPDMSRRESFIQKKHPEIIDLLNGTVGGKYVVSKDGLVRFIPKSSKSSSLTLPESSSAVRSLLDVTFFLKHRVSPGSMLMIDEPELNLHPSNQRNLARVFARLVNLGVKIFITTHSDYIIKEFNTLIMLNKRDSHLKRIAKREGYIESELLDYSKVKAYIAEDGYLPVRGKSKRVKSLVFNPMQIDADSGMDGRIFDETIEKMNSIQSEIYWGE